MFEPGDKVRCINIHPSVDERYFYYDEEIPIEDKINIGDVYIVEKFYNEDGKTPAAVKLMDVPHGYAHPASMFEPTITLQTTMDLLDQKVAEYEQRIKS